jgi:hypothetical protein
MPAHPLLNPSPAYIVKHVFASSKLPSPLQTMLLPHIEVPYRMRCVDAWVYLTNDPAVAASLQVWTGPNQTGERLCEFDCAKATSGYLHEQEKMHATGSINPEGGSGALYLWRTDSVLDGELYLMFIREHE